MRDLGTAWRNRAKDLALEAQRHRAAGAYAMADAAEHRADVYRACAAELGPRADALLNQLQALALRVEELRGERAALMATLEVAVFAELQPPQVPLTIEYEPEGAHYA